MDPPLMTYVGGVTASGGAPEMRYDSGGSNDDKERGTGVDSMLKALSANKRVRPMKRFATAAAMLLLAGITASAQTQEDLNNDGKNPDNVLTYGMGYSQHRYSPLKQINKTNVKRLVPIWNLSLDNSYGEQAQPIVYNGVMYVADAKSTVAIDVGTGKQIWKTPVDWAPEVARVVCCGISNKGVAIYDGKIYRTTLD